jgi:hypothetical protein
MYTGDPGLKGSERISKDGYYVEQNGNNPDKYRFGGFYYGRRLNSNPNSSHYARVGLNAESIRQLVQNRIIHNSIYVPYFKKLNDQWKIYSGVYSRNPFTTW